MVISQAAAFRLDHPPVPTPPPPDGTEMGARHCPVLARSATVPPQTMMPLVVVLQGGGPNH